MACSCSAFFLMENRFQDVLPILLYTVFIGFDFSLRVVYEKKVVGGTIFSILEFEDFLGLHQV